MDNNKPWIGLVQEYYNIHGGVTCDTTNGRTEFIEYFRLHKPDCWNKDDKVMGKQVSYFFSIVRARIKSGYKGNSSLGDPTASSKVCI